MHRISLGAFRSRLKGRLKEILKAKGLNASGLANVGFTQAQAKSWVYGPRLPKLQELARIAEALDLSTDYLLGLRPDLEGLEPGQLVAQESLAKFFQLAGHQIPSQHRQHLEQYCNSPIAPKTLSEWREYYEKWFLPAVGLGYQESAELRRMVRRRSSRGPLRRNPQGAKPR